jgi:hypothetical protein
LPVPVPVAAGYQRDALGYVAGILTERLPQTHSLAEFMEAGALDDTHWAAIGRTLRRFHDAGVHHADLAAGNILLDDRDAVWLIDFDRGRIRRPGAWRMTVLARLGRSLAKLAEIAVTGAVASRSCARCTTRRLAEHVRFFYNCSFTLRPCPGALQFWRSRHAPGHRARLGERLGLGEFLPAPSIWIHAVSVGEMQAAAPLVRTLLGRYPQYPVLITTVTPTGADRARQLFGDAVQLRYVPVDLPGSVRRFFIGDRGSP